MVSQLSALAWQDADNENDMGAPARLNKPENHHDAGGVARSNEIATHLDRLR